MSLIEEKKLQMRSNQIIMIKEEYESREKLSFFHILF